MTQSLLTWTVMTLALGLTTANPCTTADGFAGTCVTFTSCSYIMQMFQSEGRNHSGTIEYAKKSRCNATVPQGVCCRLSTTPPSSTPNTVTRILGERTCHMTASPWKLSEGCCGIDASVSPTILGGTVTRLDEYPWMALLEYIENNTVDFKCGGVLISGLYVLTAAHCKTKMLTPTKVRLGEHDVSNSGTDCVQAAGGGEDCNDEAISVSIKRITQHPDYDRVSKWNDIALIELTQIVEFTEFVRPICLPSGDFTVTSPSQVDLFVAGWGQMENRMLSNVKRKLQVSYVELQECKRIYENERPLWDKQICAGGEQGKDTCRGDSGGPLMRKVDGRYEFVGIISYGRGGCGNEGFPTVCTKVYDYLPWIRSEIDA